MQTSALKRLTIDTSAENFSLSNNNTAGTNGDDNQSVTDQSPAGSIASGIDMFDDDDVFNVNKLVRNYLLLVPLQI